MTKSIAFQIFASLAFLPAVAGNLAASQIYTYVDWSAASFSAGGTPGSVTGSLAFPAPITVSYTGDVANATQLNNTGAKDYYAGFSAVYTNSTVSNSPSNRDLIALGQDSFYTNTITFSAAVLDPILDIVSLGGGAPVTYSFATPFTILSQGPAFWGGCATCLTTDSTNQQLIGTEGSGVIQFAGSVSSISWTTVGGEYWNGFTVGAAGPAPSATPEPGTWMLIAAGLPLALVRRRKKQTR